MDITLQRILSLIPKGENGKFKHGAKADFARALGFKDGHIVSDWIAGNSTSYTNYLYEIAMRYNVSVEWLRGETDDPKPKNRQLREPNVTDDTVRLRTVARVAAGHNNLAFEEMLDDDIEIPVSFLHGRPASDYFMFRVQGYSMYPDYHDGDHVLVLRQPVVDYPGQVGVVIYDGENGALKSIRYTEGQKMVLESVNKVEFPPIVISGADLDRAEIVGVAKMVIREVENS